MIGCAERGPRRRGEGDRPGDAGRRARTTTLTEELLAFCREHLSRQKVPRSIDYEDELPRLPTGKLYKRILRDRYWGEGQKQDRLTHPVGPTLVGLRRVAKQLGKLSVREQACVSGVRLRFVPWAGVSTRSR